MNNTIISLKKEFKNGGAVIKENISMREYTSFMTGGNAKVGVFPQTPEALAKAVKILSQSKYCVLGNGSNVLFPDKGYDGAVLFTTAMKKVEVKDNFITAQCGAGITGVAATALKNSLSGLEFAYGIPGSIGGAVFMNAGAYGGEMSQIVQSSICVNPDGTICEIKGSEHGFAYRHSAYMDWDKIIVECTMVLEKGDYNAIKLQMDNNMSSRRAKQPLEYPNSGSTFKRPPDNFAGKLITDCGLKGYTIGGARVSEKHAGFIINIGNATSDDVLRLIEHIKNQVKKQFNVELECEVRYIC